MPTTVLVSIILTTATADPSSNPPQQRSDPEVQTLPRARAQDDGIETGKYESDFFKALIKLAERQNLNTKTFTQYQSGSPARSGVASSTLTEGRAVELKLRKKRCIVAILSAVLLSRPDTSVQQLLLFDEGGRYLDKLACAINSRYGIIKTEVSNDPEKDGAHFIVRFHADPFNKGRWHNWHRRNGQRTGSAESQSRTGNSSSSSPSS